MNELYAYREIYEQFMDESAFFWVLRSIAVDQPHYSQQELAQLEKRLEAQLDGLMTSIDLSWNLCQQALKLEQPGEVFTAAVIAFKSHDPEKIQTAVSAGLSNDDTFKGLVSALGWLPGNLVHPWMEKFFTSKDLKHKYLALAACSERQDNPAQHLHRILEREDCKQYLKLYASALKITGELKRIDLEPFVSEAMNSSHEIIKFWAVWAKILLGDKTALTRLEPFVFKKGEFQLEAINLAFRILPVEDARSWISRLASDQEQTRLVIKSTGILGDPHAVNWLVSFMDQQPLSRLAGEAFENITGINLEAYNLHQQSPVDIELIPNDDVHDQDVALDEDENLPWPDQRKIKVLWMDRQKKFTTGERYFLGRKITVASLKFDLINANQRHRHSAALELALMVPTAPLLNTRAKISG